MTYKPFSKYFAKTLADAAMNPNPSLWNHMIPFKGIHLNDFSDSCHTCINEAFIEADKEIEEFILITRGFRYVFG